MKASDVKTLDMTVKALCYRHATIHHSDRELQCCSNLYQEKLKKHGITPSMTHGYDCYQYSLAERVMVSLNKSSYLLSERS
ncbi:Conserved hypothetical protein [Vibrio atlanticus]|uniref:Uncharacterized protein n=1 Tax=Vibrio atlanticus (strain LGP32) TaxID=575788 RepID=B7VJ39_VIBA3|nr:Conserved hypothetical protein [Vibrio atlanticus]